MSQRQEIIYRAIDEATNTEIIGFEFRRGAMSEERMLANEAKLLPMIIGFIQEEQASVGK